MGVKALLGSTLALGAAYIFIYGQKITDKIYNFSNKTNANNKSLYQPKSLLVSNKILRKTPSLQKSVNVSEILNLIGQAEAPRGYNQIYIGSKVLLPKPLTIMRVSEVLEWQRQSVKAGSVSSAAGRYQIIRKTLQGLVNNGVLNGSDYFHEQSQDKAARHLLKRRGLDKYAKGMISKETFANELAKEWAGLPVVSGKNAGKSHYDGYAGNSATVSVHQVLAVI